MGMEGSQREFSKEESEDMAYASNAHRGIAAEAREKAKTADPDSQYNGPASYERDAENADRIAERQEMFALVQSKVAQMDIVNITTDEMQQMLTILENVK